MGKFDFETLSEYLDDRYTPSELIDELDIPMEVLIEYLYDWIVEHRTEKLNEIITDEVEEVEEIQLDLPF